MVASYTDIIRRELHAAGWSYGDTAAVEGHVLLTANMHSKSRVGQSS